MWRDFHQIQAMFDGLLNGLLQRHDTYIGAIRLDKPNLRNSNLLIDTIPFLANKVLPPTIVSLL
jgi:hypothetical protein